MGFFKKTGSSGVLNTVAGLLLFLLFAICSLVIIGAGAGVYSRIQAGHESTYGSSVSISYVTNKIRACDSAEIISGGSGIVLTDGGMKTVFYQENGALYEKSGAADKEIAPSGGDKISDIDSLSVTEQDGLYKISVGCGGESTTALVRKG